MKDFLYVYSQVFKKFKEKIQYLPLLMLAMGMYSIITILLQNVASNIHFSGFGFIYGLILWFLRLIMMAHFAGLILTLRSRGNLRLSDFSSYDESLVQAFSQVYFIIYLIELVFNRFIIFLPLGFLLLMIEIFWVILIGPVYELVYLGRENTSSLFSSLVEYWKNNFLCLLPMILLQVVVFFLDFQVSLSLYPFGAKVLFISVLAKGVFKGFFYFLRYLVFEETYFSNPRARSFQRKASL